MRECLEALRFGQGGALLLAILVPLALVAGRAWGRATAPIPAPVPELRLARVPSLGPISAGGSASSQASGGPSVSKPELVRSTPGVVTPSQLKRLQKPVDW